MSAYLFGHLRDDELRDIERSLVEEPSLRLYVKVIGGENDYPKHMGINHSRYSTPTDNMLDNDTVFGPNLLIVTEEWLLWGRPTKHLKRPFHPGAGAHMIVAPLYAKLNPVVVERLNRICPPLDLWPDVYAQTQGWFTSEIQYKNEIDNFGKQPGNVALGIVGLCYAGNNNENIIARFRTRERAEQYIARMKLTGEPESFFDEWTVTVPRPVEDAWLP